MRQRAGGYTSTDVTRLLHMSRSRLYALVRSGVVSPRRGARRDYRFSFTDLVILRTARDLAAAGVPPYRVRRSLRHLRQQLPAGAPLTAVRILASGNRVIVQQGLQQRDAETDQILLDFRVAELAERAAPLARAAVSDTDGQDLAAQDWYEIGCEMEAVSPDDAVTAYRAAIDIEADHADANVNLGRLLHERGDIAAAEHHYRAALRARPQDVTARYNLGVALEDLGRLPDARRAYQEVVLADPGHADAYFNLAGVLEAMGRKSEALRCLKAYRALILAEDGGRGGKR